MKLIGHEFGEWKTVDYDKARKCRVCGSIQVEGDDYFNMLCNVAMRNRTKKIEETLDE